MKSKNILISGASIAGPTLAYWLHRYGFNPTVVERAPTLRQGGYKIDVRGSATGVLDRMGLLQDAKRRSTNMEGISFVNRDNKPMFTMSADFLMGREADDVELMRADLSGLLYEASCRNTEYIFDDSITALAQAQDGVRVTFEQNAPRTFDLVIGADGLHSNVRALAFGDESAFLKYLGSYISIFSTTTDLPLDHKELFYATPGHMANLYSTGGKQAKALLAFASEPLTYDRRNVAAQKQLLAKAFAREEWLVPELLQSMWDATDFYFDSMSQVQMESWFRGRIALVGDAGYCPSPASGQGTSLALVGAYVLAGELAAAAGDYQTAFARYNEQMRGYITQNLELGIKMAQEMVPTSRFQFWLRSQMMRMLPYLPWKRMIVKQITDPLQHAANAITLKNYVSAA